MKSFFCYFICVTLVARANSQSNPLGDSSMCIHAVLKSSKLHGAIVTLALPCQWQYREPSNEKVLAMFTDVVTDSGLVLGALNFSYSDFVFSKEELDYLLSDEELRATTKQSGTYISGKRIKINGIPTGEILLKTESDVVGTKVYSYKCYYYLYTARGTAMLFFTVQSDVEAIAKRIFYDRLGQFRLMSSKTTIK